MVARLVIQVIFVLLHQLFTPPEAAPFASEYALIAQNNKTIHKTVFDWALARPKSRSLQTGGVQKSGLKRKTVEALSEAGEH